MTKRLYRTARAEQPAAYPTLDEFDRGRRDFLGQLCTAALGATAASALAGCGHRPVESTTDGGPTPAPDARTTTTPDSKRPDPDSWGMSGGARPEDSRVDEWTKAQPDANLLEGDVAGPDARIDEIDAGSAPTPSPGYGPTMDARIDNGSCGNP
jgi:hypothetical protein